MPTVKDTHSRTRAPQEKPIHRLGTITLAAQGERNRGLKGTAAYRLVRSFHDDWQRPERPRCESSDEDVFAERKREQGICYNATLLNRRRIDGPTRAIPMLNEGGGVATHTRRIPLPKYRLAK